jgi:hypothetical protein
MTTRIAIQISFVLGVVFGLAAPASAEPRPVVLGDQPPVAAPPKRLEGTAVLYLNRCALGCTVYVGPNDAPAHTTPIPCTSGANCPPGAGVCFCQNHGAGAFQLQPFQDQTGMAGTPAADADWAAIVQCVKEIYSPFNITVTDQQPTGVVYSEGIVAGEAMQIGYPNSASLGFGSVQCGGANNGLSFTFANEALFPGRVQFLCGVIGQETAHSFGLEHEYEFIDGTSACRDPMSYRNDCGGQRFFRNKIGSCGEGGPRSCECGGLQNTHQKLLTILGPGTPITRPPHVELIIPANGATVNNGASVAATSGSQRGIERVELWLNGHKWASAPGAAWTSTGQPDPSTYNMQFPANVPDGIIDIDVKAFEDIETEADSPTITVTKGAPCVSADACAKGQKCDAGKCYWDPPTGMLGDACTYSELCLSDICAGTADKTICTQQCVLGSTDGCPPGYDCIMTSQTGGVCFPAGAGNDTCCSIGHGPHAVWIHGALAFVVLAVIRRRRRRR